MCLYPRTVLIGYNSSGLERVAVLPFALTRPLVSKRPTYQLCRFLTRADNSRQDRRPKITWDLELHISAITGKPWLNQVNIY